MRSGIQSFLQLSTWLIDHRKYTALDALKQHDWSGNIRELRNVVERLVILGGKTITDEDVEMYVLPKNK